MDFGYREQILMQQTVKRLREGTEYEYVKWMDERVDFPRTSSGKNSLI